MGKIFGTYKISLIVVLFFVAVNSQATELVKATTISGAGAIELSFSDNIDPKSINKKDFKIEALSTRKELYPVAYAYADPADSRKIILLLYKQLLRWIPLPYLYNTVYISYTGNSLENEKGDSVAQFSNKIVECLDILGKTNSLFVKPIPAYFQFEDDLWGKNDTLFKTSDTIHVNNRLAISSDENPGTENAPLKTISKAITMGGPGIMIFVHNGIYHETITIPKSKSGNELSPFQLIGENQDSVIITGKDSWKDSVWTFENNMYVRNWPFKWGLNSDANTIPNELGRHRENIFVDGKKYDQVLTTSNMREKTYCINNNLSKLFIKLPTGITPDSVLIEVSVRENGITVGDPWSNSAWPSYFVIKNLNFSYFNNNNEIHGRHYLVKNCKFEWNNNIGARTGGEDYLLKNCIFRNNGCSGVDIPPRLNGNGEYVSVNGLFESCTLSHNNWRVGGYGNQRGWFVGGAKVHGIFNIIFRACSFTNNLAPGLWMDNKVNNALVEDCLFANNSESGIWSEISYGNTYIRNNTIYKNNTGITISNSGYLHAEGNIIFDNNSQIGSWEPDQNREEAFKTIYPFFKQNAVGGNNLFQLPTWNSLYATINVDSNYYQNSNKAAFNSMDFISWQKKIKIARKDTISENHSVMDDFGFSNPALYDFTPKATSKLANTPNWAFVNFTKINDSTYSLESNKANIEIRYTTDGTLPTKSSSLYSSPLKIKKGEIIAARVYRIINRENTLFSPVTYSNSAKEVDSSKLQISGQIEIVTYKETPIIIKNTDVNLNADGFIRICNGENYTAIDNKLIPAKDFIGELKVPIIAMGFNGRITSDTFQLKVKVIERSLSAFKLQITGQKTLKILKNSSLAIANSSVTTNVNPFFIEINPGNNFTIVNDIIVPDSGYLGELQVPVRAFGISGEAPSDTFFMKVSVVEFLTNLKTSIQHSFKAFPVPCNDFINLEFEPQSGNGNLTIYSGKGELMYSGVVHNANQIIATKDFSPGVYYIKYVVGENVQVITFLKN